MKIYIKLSKVNTYDSTRNGLYGGRILLKFADPWPSRVSNESSGIRYFNDWPLCIYMKEKKKNVTCYYAETHSATRRVGFSMSNSLPASFMHAGAVFFRCYPVSGKTFRCSIKSTRSVQKILSRVRYIDQGRVIVIENYVRVKMNRAHMRFRSWDHWKNGARFRSSKLKNPSKKKIKIISTDFDK